MFLNFGFVELYLLLFVLFVYVSFWLKLYYFVVFFVGLLCL